MTSISGLKAKSVIVTGGASGIGRAAVESLLANGAQVTIGDLAEKSGEELVGRLVEGGHSDVQFVLTDVRDEESAEALVASAVKRFGKLDGAVNCAGLSPRGVPLHEMGAEQWQAAQSVNLSGMFHSVKHEMRAMAASGAGGAIVAISSLAATQALPASAEYCASKAGINGLVRAAAVDGAGLGVRVNGVMPGPIRTPMLEDSSQDNAAFAVIAAGIPLGRIGEAEEVANAAVWLVSDQARYVTGAVLPVDGGLGARG